MVLVYFSLLNHTAAMYNFIRYTITLKYNNEIINLSVNDSDNVKIIHLLNGLPSLIDSLIIVFNTNSLYYRNNMLVITMLIFINGMVKPFYHMNHLAFHVLLFFQTIFLCQSNVYVNEHM